MEYIHMHTHTYVRTGMGHYLLEAFAYKSVSSVMALCVLVLTALDVRTMYKMTIKDQKEKKRE